MYIKKSLDYFRFTGSNNILSDNFKVRLKTLEKSNTFFEIVSSAQEMLKQLTQIIDNDGNPISIEKKIEIYKSSNNHKLKNLIRCNPNNFVQRYFRNNNNLFLNIIARLQHVCQQKYTQEATVKLTNKTILGVNIPHGALGLKKRTNLVNSENTKSMKNTDEDYFSLVGNKKKCYTIKSSVNQIRNKYMDYAMFVEQNNTKYPQFYRKLIVKLGLILSDLTINNHQKVTSVRELITTTSLTLPPLLQNLPILKFYQDLTKNTQDPFLDSDTLLINVETVLTKELSILKNKNIKCVYPENIYYTPNYSSNKIQTMQDLENGIYKTLDNEYFQVFEKKIFKLSLKEKYKVGVWTEGMIFDYEFINKMFSGYQEYFYDIARLPNQKLRLPIAGGQTKEGELNYFGLDPKIWITASTVSSAKTHFKIFSGKNNCVGNVIDILENSWLELYADISQTKTLTICNPQKIEDVVALAKYNITTLNATCAHLAKFADDDLIETNRLSDIDFLNGAITQLPMLQKLIVAYLHITERTNKERLLQLIPMVELCLKYYNESRLPNKKNKILIRQQLKTIIPAILGEIKTTHHYESASQSEVMIIN